MAPANYVKIMNRVMNHCGCCPECNDVPCTESAAGRLCRQRCRCDAVEEAFRELNFNEPDWTLLDDSPFDDEEDDPMQDAMDRCGRLQEGFCTLAGTEHCDFECPFRD